ncbi:GntR family transcriptional regulator, partial [Kitasatospora sp. NPDC036755]|uniref:GntR family transcriptional regulator n=1 Tax=Kitasatospora sp. NPDC036755 TaxID=3154600 RepID=UPI0033C91D5B
MNRSKAEGSDRSKEVGADFLQLDTADAPPGGLTDWLARRLREAVADGRLPVGSRLPAGRVLAAELGVSRGVVTEAYQRLAEEGQVAGRGRGGTVVVAAATAAPEAASETRPPSPAPALFRAEPGPEVFDLLRATPARIDLAPGVPDLEAFPR